MVPNNIRLNNITFNFTQLKFISLFEHSAKYPENITITFKANLVA